MASAKTPLPKASPRAGKIQTEADAQSIKYRASNTASGSHQTKKTAKVIGKKNLDISSK